MTEILLVVDSLNWGGHHSARAVAKLCGGHYNFSITDIEGVTKMNTFNYDLIMAWLDAGEEEVYAACQKHGIKMASRIAGWKGVWRTTRLNPEIHKTIKGVVCCNPDLQIASSKIYPTNVVTIMNGVNTDAFKPAEKYARNGSWLWVGRTRDEQKDYRLFQQVDATYKRKINVVAQKRVGNKVVPTDWPMEMVDHYQKAKGFLRTSRNEGSSNCLLEAMSCGLPVVATPTGIAPRLLPPRNIATATRHITKAMRDFDDVNYALTVGAANRKTILDGWQWRFKRGPYLKFFKQCME